SLRIPTANRESSNCPPFSGSSPPLLLVRRTNEPALLDPVHERRIDDACDDYFLVEHSAIYEREIRLPVDHCGRSRRIDEGLSFWCHLFSRFRRWRKIKDRCGRDFSF